MKTIKGYHGTSKINADNIIKKNEFNISQGEKHWLGNGIYFFEHESLAEWWAKTKLKNSKNKYFYNSTATVLEVEINVKKEKYLDLSDPVVLMNYHTKHYKEKLNVYASNADHKRIIPNNKNKLALFSIFLELYKKEKNIEVVKCIFNKDGYQDIGEIKNDTNDFLVDMKLSEIQICVISNENISNIKIAQ